MNGLLTLVHVACQVLAVAETAERLWARWRDHQDRKAPVVPAQREPDWFAQARREIDRLTH